MRANQLNITIRERKDRPGKWVVDVRRGDQRSVRQVEDYQAAKEFKAELERAERQGALKPPTALIVPTLGRLAREFLASKKSEGLAPNTLLTYESLILKAVLPALGEDRNVKSLTAADIEGFKEKRLQEASPTTVRAEMDRLRAVLDFAQLKGHLTKNVVKAVRLPKLRDDPQDWLRSPEIAPFLDACVGDFATVARFTIFTGLRRGEVVFLQRGDIDLINNVIQIRAKPHLGFRPKSGRERSVPLDPTLRPLIERHLKEQVGPELEAWVFPQRSGKQRSPKTRWFAISTQEAVERIGIKRPMTFHDLRRTYGAMLIEAGVGIYEVSRLLGHADVRITQKVYAPICGKFLAVEASKLGRYLAASLIRPAPEAPALPEPREKLVAS